MQGYSSWVIEFQGRHYAIPPNGLRIGRGQDNEIVLQDDQVSRRHATVWVVQGNVYIRDERSTNGTFVRGQRIAAPTLLRPGDQVQIGRALLRVQTGRTPGAPAYAQPVYRGSSNQTWMIVAGVTFLLCTFIAAGIALVFVLKPSAPSNIAFSTPSPTLAYATTTSPSTILAPTPPLSPIPSLTLSVPTNTPMPTQTMLPTRDPIQVALMASVLIIVPIGTTDNVMIGSGSIIDPRGLILTNSHVVRDSTTDKPFNNSDLIYIAVYVSADKAPDLRFRAEIVARDRALDLAVLKINALFDGKPLPSDLNLVAVPLGDSDQVQIRDRLIVVGYPGTGQSGTRLSSRTVTLTEGVVAGFAENRAWIKTDTEIGHGNSGGMALNVAGKLIGVPTAGKMDADGTGKMGYIRPINLAKPLIERAK